MPAKYNNISLCVIHEEDISPELDRAIRETLVVCFPADREYFQRQNWWHCVPVYRVLGRDDKGSESLAPLEIIVNPNETVTFAVQSSNSSTMEGELLWRELW